MTQIIEDDELMHIGIIRRSGRYPWGSGKNPFQRSKMFKAYYDEMREQGLSDVEIAKGITEYARANGYDGPDFKTTDLRAASAVSTEQIRENNRGVAMKLKEDHGMSTSAIARELGVNESTVRGWLKPSEERDSKTIRATAEQLKRELEEKPYLDVGSGNEYFLGITDTKLRQALAVLRDEGYEVHLVQVPQLGTDKMTTARVLTKEGVTKKEVYDNRGEIQLIGSQSDDGGLTYTLPSSNPSSVSSKRIQVKYAEDGGDTMDGVIELRRGVADLDLGAKGYAQVRIAVDGTHFLKGMAMYTDDLPAGVDIRFNTNKKKSDVSSDYDAMKPMKTAPDGSIDTRNPFGASIRRVPVYKDASGKERNSALNIINEEGSWDDWSDALSSQFLSKQSLSLASTQLKKAQTKRQEDLDTILSMTNPVVKKKLLEEYADGADSAAVHLKAAAMRGQANRVLLPMNSMRPNEVYAPGYKDGERVVLVRHPHGGPFEIPSLTVNNKNRRARQLMGDAFDAIGIHHSVAAQLSGADFDGDAVLVIPNNDGRIKSRDPLPGLKNFEPKTRYAIPNGDTTIKRMTKEGTQKEMGMISNLITDMTIHKASDDELTKAIRHSMVVIDAEKHGLNYKQSELDNEISRLRKKYQTGPRGGASTLISRASSEARVPERKYLSGNRGIDPDTGKRRYVETGATYVDPKTGKVKRRETTGTKMEFVDDAFELSSNTPMENVYASYANSMKSLANRARRESIAIKPAKASPPAKAAYSKEVKSLNDKLETAKRNRPLERRAQIIGNAMAKARIDADPSLDKDHIKKIKYQELEAARQRTGASKKKIYITDREWEAIQSRAVAPTTLRDMLANADMDRVKELAKPKSRSSLTPGQIARAKAMQARGLPMSQVSEALGIPRTTLIDNINR